ncbi:MAG: ester cyclase [Thermomicrobiales bacterium]
MRRRPVICLLTSILALLTAAALIGSALTVAAPRVADLSPANGEVVHAFYTALNTAIRTGDAAELNVVVAADFVSHDALPGVTPDRAGLERYLTVVHVTAPGAEIVVKDVTVVGNRAMARVAVHDREDKLAFLGVPLRSRPPVWGTVDAFRIAGRQVVEHWGGTPGLALLEPLNRGALDLTAPDRPLLSLDRLSISAGGSFTAKGASEARLLFVESGSVTVTSTPLTMPEPMTQAPSVETMEPADDTTSIPTSLTAGDIFVVPTWNQTELRTPGAATASLLVVAAAGPSMNEHRQNPALSESTLLAANEAGLMPWRHGFAVPLDTGATMTPLAGAMQATLPGRHPVVAVGRATLAPGADLTVHQASGPSLLVVEQGVLDLAADGDGAWVRRAENGGSTSRDVATLTAGDGALLHMGTSAVLANHGAEPVVLTVVAVGPSGASA